VQQAGDDDFAMTIHDRPETPSKSRRKRDTQVFDASLLRLLPVALDIGATAS